MAEQLRVKFGTTQEALRESIMKLADTQRWDKSRIYYVIDIHACTVKETVYAVSNRTADLPLHPNGPTAVQRIS
ncbi:MAG: hypothetical protein O2954_12455 [bacterium]|nr:hypothetical protein [bacterium]